MPGPPSTTHRKSPTWVLARPGRAVVRALVETEGLPEIVATLLANRGFEAGAKTREHLAPELKRLHDPFLLPGMRAATARLRRAILNGERILVHGDYDVDGVTGTALLMRLFRHLGAAADWHIPNRFTDGYSFGEHSVKKAQEVDAKVVISVDNGTSAATTIAQLAAAGIETIVTDHHEPPTGPNGEPGELPAATAIVNPKLDGGAYPFRELCGGAVAFKLAWGLCQEISGESRVRDDLREFLVDAMGYVAIATVCDVVPLVDENRILAHYGLRALAQTKTPGLRALLSVAGLAGSVFTAEDVGFQIGPRINASGRLGTAETAVELLLATDDGSARELARKLDDLNKERRRIERALLTEATAASERFRDVERWPVLVVAGEGWHQGVVGIVAARLAEQFERPAVVIGLEGAEGRGSARSVAGFSVLEALHGGAEHVLRYGGHEQAAGLEIEQTKICALREAVCARARAMLGANEGYPGREVKIDCEVPFAQFSPETMRAIDRLEPFGQHNEKPIFFARDVRLAEPARTVSDGKHLMLRVRRGERVMKAMGFGLGHRSAELAMGTPLHLVFTPRWNTFRGETALELLIVDFETGAESPSLA